MDETVHMIVIYITAAYMLALYLAAVCKTAAFTAALKVPKVSHQTI